MTPHTPPSADDGAQGDDASAPHSALDTPPYDDGLVFQYHVPGARAPYPVPRAYIRDLCAAVADPEHPTSLGQREAARMLKVSERTVRYWCSDVNPKECPWAAAELLRRLIIERRGGDDRGLPDPAAYRPDEYRAEPMGGGAA